MPLSPTPTDIFPGQVMQLFLKRFSVLKVQIHFVMGHAE